MFNINTIPNPDRDWYTDNQEENPGSAKKSRRMNKEEMREMFQTFKSEFNNEYKEDMNKHNEKTLGEIKVLHNQLTATFLEDQAKVNSETANRIEELEFTTHQRFQALEARFQRLESEAANARRTSTSTADPSSSPTWKANLAKDVFEHEHGLIIHGLRCECSSEATKVASIKAFMKDKLKASDEIVSKIRIKDITRLGADNGVGKPPPILVKLGHPTERNLLLPLSKNLKKDDGVTMDKNIPKIYQKKHKEFKRQAWKLSMIHNVQSQVIFEGCKLVLRYKKKDDGLTQYNYTTEREWVPQPEDLT